jgi:TRAP-type C4-dicarboxylate transport system substrate-binding protein
MDLQKQLEESRVADLKKLGMEVVVPPSLDPYRKIASEIKKRYTTKYAKFEWAKWHDRVLNIGK